MTDPQFPEPISSDVHDDATAVQIAAYYRNVTGELIAGAEQFGVRPTTLIVATLLSSASAEIVVPESGGLPDVDALGDHYQLQPGTYTPLAEGTGQLYQRVGHVTLAEADELFLIVRTTVPPQVPATVAAEPVVVEPEAPIALTDTPPVPPSPRQAETIQPA